MRSPYFINEPAAISFSGGRTSAYMLWRVLQAHGGTLPDYVKVVFANTGKEMPQTLDFVRDCGEQWGVDIVWLELSGMTRTEIPGKRTKIITDYKRVTHATASRNGEPFDILLDSMKAIPNAIQRSCTGYMKVRAVSRHMKSLGMGNAIQLVGIRGDEQRRAAKIHGQRNGEPGGDRHCPLWLDGVTKEDVGNFWRNNNFDLNLPNNNGTTDWGNCDLCHLKAQSKRMSIIRERPDLADWWLEAERKKGQFFRPGQPSYEKMKVIATDQGNLFEFAEQESISCFCGD
jgi:3'-phosphoadenosine 5'-phosphosulfate sulfotransferase (PAPS reductase)/FAD synthetase